MSHIAYDWAKAQKGLKAATKQLLQELADCFNPEHGCFPSLETLSDKCGMSVRSVQNHIDKLARLGLLRVEKMPRKRGQLPRNRYRFPFESEATEEPDSTFGKNCLRQSLPMENSASHLWQNLPPNPVRINPVADHDALRGVRHEPSFARDSHQRMANMLTAAEDGIYARLNATHQPTIGRDFAGMTLAETAATIRAAKGLPVITGGPGAIIDVELGLQQRAVGMHATGDFPAILGNVANKSLLAHYQTAQSALLRLSRRRQAADFKPISNVRLGGALGLDKVPESAEYSYGTISESSEKFVIATYGKIIALTRQLLINDDLGAFHDFTRIQGHGAAETEANLIVGLLEANSGAGPTLSDGNPVFHASHGNIATGAAPSIVAVSAMQTILRRQKGLEGESIHVVPFALVVPPELETAALQVVAELYPADTASANPFTNRLEVVVESRLADTGAWYLTAAPGQPDSLQHAYLASEPGPQFMSRVGWEVDGVEFKCRLDFGAGFVDWRGWVKNPGA